jgi:hypothetical protein
LFQTRFLSYLKAKHDLRLLRLILPTWILGFVNYPPTHTAFGNLRDEVPFSNVEVPPSSALVACLSVRCPFDIATLIFRHRPTILRAVVIGCRLPRHQWRGQRFRQLDHIAAKTFTFTYCLFCIFRTLYLLTRSLFIVIILLFIGRPISGSDQLRCYLLYHLYFYVIRSRTVSTFAFRATFVFTSSRCVRRLARRVFAWYHSDSAFLLLILVTLGVNR